jgi:hypothetical protein
LLGTALVAALCCIPVAGQQQDLDETAEALGRSARQAAAQVEDVVDDAVDGSVWERPRWSPYAVGIGIGILSWFTFLLSDKALGVSSAYARTAGMIERLFHGRKALEKPYYQKVKPAVDWEWMLVLGILIGAFLSARLSGDFAVQMVPQMWDVRFGASTLLRFAVALAGGILIGIGARWADGCTSGHGISGTLQLTLSSWIAVLCFFAGGVVTAMLLY